MPKLNLDNQEWKNKLSPEEFEVLRNKGNLYDKISINFSKANLPTGLYFIKIISQQDEYYSKITYLR